MTEEQVIIEKSGAQLNSCACDHCKSMCQRAPCLGTPAEMLAIAKAGFADRLEKITWAAGYLKYGIPMIDDVIRPKMDKIKGACTFYTEAGLCQLHDLGLKPMEGRLADCKTEFVPADKVSVYLLGPLTWDRPENNMIIEELDFLIMENHLQELFNSIKNDFE